jgi:hypothetical protein
MRRLSFKLTCLPSPRHFEDHMPRTNSHSQRRLQWLAVGIITCIFLYTALDRLLFPTWREGYIALQVHYADGNPAAGLGVRIHPIDAISYTPRGIRRNMTILGTQSDGTWRDFNSEHYGRYEVTLFSDTHFTTPIPSAAVRRVAIRVDDEHEDHS